MQIFILTADIVLSPLRTLQSEFVVFPCLCIYLPYDDLAEIEICRRTISDQLLLLLLLLLSICFIKYCFTTPVYNTIS